jgi:adenylate cyclase
MLASKPSQQVEADSRPFGNPSDSVKADRALAATYGQTGRFDEAREQWREVFRINPAYSLDHRRKVLPYKNPGDFEPVVDGLRKAGLVE